MAKAGLKRVSIRLPDKVAGTISDREIIDLLRDKALSKLEYYKSRCKQYEERYNMNLPSFKKKAEEGQGENFTEWDDLLLWEGYELAYREWEEKYEELMGV